MIKVKISASDPWELRSAETAVYSALDNVGWRGIKTKPKGPKTKNDYWRSYVTAEYNIYKE